MLHGGVALGVGHRTSGVERRGTRVDEVDETAGSQTGGFLAGDALHSLGAPVGTDVREHHTLVGKQMTEEHSHAVERVVLGGEHVGLTCAVPVKRGTHQRLGEVKVGDIVGPLALALHTGSDGVVAQTLLLEAQLLETRVAVHQVVDDKHILDGELPVLVLLLAGLGLAYLLVVVVALIGLAVLLGPSHGLLVLLRVIDTLVHTAQDFDQVHILGTHAEIVLEEVGVDDTSGNTHTGVTHAQIALAAHRSHSLCGAGKAQYLFCHVGWDSVVVEVLHIMAVDAESRQTLLGMGSQNGSQIHGAGALGTVEAPDSLGIVGVHIHGLRTIAPA